MKRCVLLARPITAVRLKTTFHQQKYTKIVCNISDIRKEKKIERNEN